MSNEQEIETIDVPRTGFGDAEVYYTNSVTVRVSIYDFELQINRLEIGPDGPTAAVLARLIMSPQHAKALLALLARNVAVYEQSFGELIIEPLAPETSPQPPAASAPRRPSSRSRSGARKKDS